ncbi:twin transmembrane helix small protein [Oceaniglobus indicus]|uniref:twin transmembrane helix small protein n=1 Tax=Oceaniglobus indicus TaxID=2047749 RepID=UPI000C18031D|nr:twin transmembrane helix small protein [Oceaniglobus indicus]
MFNDPLFVVAAVSALLVLVILAVGIAGFGKGGEFNRKHSNRMMRWRIYAQAAAIVLILVFVFFRGTGG